MIKFGENNKVENIRILEKEEAEAYIRFLGIERKRHEADIRDCELLMALLGHGETLFSQAMVAFFESAIRRHEEDIKAIDVLVTTLKGFYGIK